MSASPAIAAWQPSVEQLNQAETPCYLFDPTTVIATYQSLRATLGTPLLVSFKANPNVDLFVRCAHAFTDGIELASQGELNLVAGRTSAPRFVNSPALDLPFMRAAAAARATLVLDSLHQVDMAAGLASGGTSLLPIVLRANAVGVLGASAGRVQGDHFGMDAPELAEAISRLRRVNLAVRGLHVFAGSYTFDVCAPQLFDSALQLQAALNEKLDEPMSFLNLGGGFADDWTPDSPKFAEYRRALARKPEHLSIVHEAGRATFARGGVFATRVLGVKRVGRRYAVICDGGLAHCFMLAQTEKVMKRLRRPRIVAADPALRPANDLPVIFVGNSCNRSDVIGEMSDGVLPHPGDMAVFDSCGSYHSYSPRNFLELKSPKHYVVS